MSPTVPPLLLRTVRREGDAVIAEVVGEVDLRGAPAFQQAVLALAAEKPKRLIIDLSGVPFMDSSGVASLVKLLARTRKAHTDLRLAGLNGHVRGVFEITRLAEVFDIYDGVEEALTLPWRPT